MEFTLGFHFDFGLLPPLKDDKGGGSSRALLLRLGWLDDCLESYFFSLLFGLRMGFFMRVPLFHNVM